MYNNVTEAFKETIRSPSRTFEARLKINGRWFNSEFKKLSYETSSFTARSGCICKDRNYY